MAASSCLPTTQDNDSFEYNMNHTHRGMAIIFNHLEFDFNDEENRKQFKNRDGSDKDVEALQTSLKRLGFKDQHIKVENDLVTDVIKGYRAQRMSNKELEIIKKSDCIAIFILSYSGKGNQIYGHDNTYDLYDFIHSYTPNLFPELAGKPKLFFINASHVVKLDHGVTSQSIPPNASFDVINKPVFSFPIKADIFISFSSHHDHTSILTPEGSWYIQDLCAAIDYFCGAEDYNFDITQLISHTQYLVSKRVSDRRLKQVSNYNSSLCRKLCFKREI